MTTYDRIIELARKQNLTVHGLEMKLGVSNGTISRLKYNENNQLSMKSAKIIADYFGVSIAYILNGECNGKPIQQDAIVTPPSDGDEFESILIETYRDLDAKSKFLLIKYATDLLGDVE